MFFVDSFFFFFKQKTAYEMRISDWSSDVCSSDLRRCLLQPEEHGDDVHLQLPPGSNGEPEVHAAAEGSRREIRRGTVLFPRSGVVRGLHQGARTLRVIRERSEERRGGKECVSTCRSRGSPDH